MAFDPDAESADRTRDESSHPPVNESADDPHRLARSFVQSNYMRDGTATLRKWQGEWYRWEPFAWVQWPEAEVRADLTRHAKGQLDEANRADLKAFTADPQTFHGRKPVCRKVTERLVGDVAHALASRAILPGRVEPPCWLAGGGSFPPGEVLNCRNGLVHLPAYVGGRLFP